MNIDSSIIIGTILDPDGVRKGVAKAEKELKKLKDVEIRADIKQSKVEGSEKAVNNLEKERERILARIAQKETEKFNTEQASRKVNQEKLAIDKKTLESKIRQNRTDRIALTADVKEQKGIASKSNLAADRTSLANTKKQLKSVKDEAIDLKNELAKVKVDIKKINAVELAKTTGLADKIQMEQSEGTRVIDRRIVGAKNTFEKDKLDLIKVNEELDRARIKAQDLQDKAGKINFNKVKKSVSGILGGISDIVKKVGLWAGAMFGVRSMYLGIRKLISTISGMNLQVKTDLEYITFAIAKEFEGIVIQIIQWIYKLMGYIKYIAKAWFGLNLFAGATTEAFKQQEAAVGGTVSKVKELKRELASFDEMNRLSKGLDDTGGGGGGGGAPVLDPSFDLSQFDADVPEWVKWIGDNKEPILKWLTVIAGVLGGIKLLTWIADLKKVGEVLAPVWKGLKKVWEFLFAAKEGASTATGVFSGLLKVLGWVAAAFGAFEYIKGAIDYIKLLDEESYPMENTTGRVLLMNEQLQNLGIIIMGLGGITGNLGVAATGLGVAFAGLAGETAFTTTTLGEQNAANELLRGSTDELVQSKLDAIKAEEKLSDVIDIQINLLQRQRDNHKRLQEAEKDSIYTGEQLQAQIDEGSRSLEDLSNKELTVLSLYRKDIDLKKQVKEGTVQVKEATDGLSEANLTTAENAKEQQGIMLIQAATAIETSQDYDAFKKSVVEAFNEGKVTGERAAQALMIAARKMKDESVKNIKDIPDAMIKEMTPKNLKKIDTELGNWATGLFNDLKRTLSKKIDLTVEAEVHFSGRGGPFTTGGGNAKGAIYYPPELARGGIINYPNHGIPIGSAIGGERGAEGVIPLTDSQMMSQLGEAIGRFITVNNTIMTNLNGRTINKELRKIQGQENFALNGGL